MAHTTKESPEYNKHIMGMMRPFMANATSQSRFGSKLARKIRSVFPRGKTLYHLQNLKAS